MSKPIDYITSETGLGHCPMSKTGKSQGMVYPACKLFDVGTYAVDDYCTIHDAFKCPLFAKNNKGGLY